MSGEKKSDVIHTRIWLEEPEADNPFATRAAHCHGYDVYGEMLGNARWVQMLYLLLRREAPTPAQTELLEALAVALANPGPRDPSIHAAMCGGIGGSSIAACLMAALAVGAGHQNGAREVFHAMHGWETCDTNLDAWRNWVTATTTAAATDVWPAPEHPPGFDPCGDSISTIARQTLERLAPLSPGRNLPWLLRDRRVLEQAVGRPMALSGVAAAALVDLGFSAEQGEALYLLLRLPGAAAHALEQRGHRYNNFPFFSLELENDPAAKADPTESSR